MNWDRRPPWRRLGRWALVVLVTLVAVQNTASSAGGHYLSVRSAVAVVCGAALLARPLPWFAAPVLASLGAAVWGWPMLPLLLIGLFDLAARRRAWVAVGCVVAAMGGNVVTRPAGSLWTPQQYGSSLFLLLAVVGGLWLGNRRRLVEALATQVDHLHLERELREQAARAAERSRIAAEMHDVLAHRLSLIALHTGVLTTKAATLPAPVVERLALLRTASTEALTDLRGVLGALHGPEPSATHPVLREVDDLVDEARAAGQDVDVSTDGSSAHVPAAHRLAAYRILQEALTNARRHAHGAPVRVRLDYTAPATTIEVTNTAGSRTTNVLGSGFGLVGLRERVVALGGHLHAAPDGAGAWRLAASIPHPAGGERNGAPP